MRSSLPSLEGSSKPNKTWDLVLFCVPLMGRSGMDCAVLDAFKSLPEDPDELRSVIEQMLQHIQSQAYQIEKLKAELHGLRRARFGSKSEGMDQLALDLPEDDEIAQAAADQHTEPSPGDEEGPPNKRQHSRKPLPDHLGRKDEVLSPGEACAGCGGTLRQVGEDVTEELDYIPSHFTVRRFIRPRMACTCCEAVAQAPLPSRLIERRRPGPGLVSHMLVGKYCDHLPLERQSKIYAREGVDLHRSTLSDWVGRTTALLGPLRPPRHQTDTQHHTTTPHQLVERRHIHGRIPFEQSLARRD